MNLRFLLDTNILSESVRQLPSQNMIEKLQQYEGEITTSTTIWHELVFGCSRLLSSQKRIFLERYLYQVIRPTIPILPYDIEAAIWRGIERARLMSIGKIPAFPDGQIAAVTKVNGLILVTNNVSDYRDFLDLQKENWLE